MAAKIRKGDRVVVLTGKDKGREGQVSKVFPKEDRVLVDGLNMVQRHTRPSQGDPQGGIENVAWVDSKGNPTRFRFRMDGDKKVRFAKTTGEVIANG
jgi:large subunit ribosomal protein L24